MTERIFLAGHNGMVGSAILRSLEKRDDIEVITKSRAELDLTNQAAVRDFFQAYKPDSVILAAAKVGGILANSTYPADFIYQNTIIAANVIHQAYVSGVERLLQLGSSCIYPRAANQPIEESALLTGPLEPTNEPYAIAKITAIKLCESYNRQYGTDYRSVMPTNLYGPGDNYDKENSHVIPGLIRRFVESKETGASEVVIWGSGQPLREFLHVDDMASASLFVHFLPKRVYKVATSEMQSHINVGSGEEVSIAGLSELIAGAVGFKGRLVFDNSKPDGAPRKLMNNSVLRELGWEARIPLHQGIVQTVENCMQKGSPTWY